MTPVPITHPPVQPTRLYLAWVGANSLAWFVAFIPFGRIPFSRASVPEFEGWLLLLLGLVIGLAQWLVLRRHLPLGVWWVLLNSVAWAMAWFVSIFGTILIGLLLFPLTNLISPILTSIVANLLFSALTGAVLGGVQWATFYMHLERANWWIPATMGGTAAAGLVRLLTGDTLRAGFDASWLAYSLITGVVLVWMLDDGHRRGW